MLLLSFGLRADAIDSNFATTTADIKAVLTFDAKVHGRNVEAAWHMAQQLGVSAVHIAQKADNDSKALLFVTDQTKPNLKLALAHIDLGYRALLGEADSPERHHALYSLQEDRKLALIMLNIDPKRRSHK